MADATYQPKTYHKRGGDEFVVADGGQLTFEGQGTVTQATSKSTGVTLNKISGRVSMLLAPGIYRFRRPAGISCGVFQAA